MSLVLIPVLFRAVRANGVVVAGARVRARLTVDERDDCVVVPLGVDGETDANGECVLNLWPNSRGVNGSDYTVVIDGGEHVYFSGRITVSEIPSTAWPVLMDALINQPPYPARSVAEAAQIAASAAAVQVAVDAAAVAANRVAVNQTAAQVELDRAAVEDARDDVTAATSTVAAITNQRESVEAALGDSTISVGAIFWAPLADGTWQSYLKNSSGEATAVGSPVTSAARVAALEDALPNVDTPADIAFGVIDKDGRRTWLEAAGDGGPTARAKQILRDVSHPEIETPADIAFGVIDKDGRRTWLEAAGDGGPTIHTKQVLRDVSYPEIDTPADIAFGVVDKDGRRTWLEAAGDGGPTARAASLIAEKIGLEFVSETPSAYKSTYADTDINIVSGPDIVCWGDSMTAGAGGGGTTYPSVLQTLLAAAGSNATVRNAGVGGETSVTIAARAGATPFLLLPTTGAIPASGGVAVTLADINGYAPAPLVQATGTPGTTFTGYLAGVLGTLSRAAVDDVVTYTFTRSTAGSAVSVTRPQPYRTLFSDARRGDIPIIWIGQNGPSNVRAIQDAWAIINHSRALDKRYLVISKPGGTSAADVDDAAWFAEFGRRFVPIRQYMVRWGLDDAGIDATEDDLANIASGTIPISLRVDAVHWNAAGYTILANIIFQRITELGWV